MSYQAKNYEIQFLGKDRRVLDGRIYDVIDYTFAVSGDDKKCNAA